MASLINVASNPQIVDTRHHVYKGGTVADGSVPSNIISTEIHPSTKKVAKEAFMGIQTLKHVVLHDGITDIGEGAFVESGIEGEVIIPKEVQRIKRGTFHKCPNLKRVVFHDDIISMGEEAFSESGIEGEVIIPKKVEIIERCTFYKCPNLKGVVLHNGITTIGEFAFADSGIEGEVIIPNKVQIIARYTFCKCPNLTHIIFHNLITDIAGNAFVGCGLKVVVIPPNFQFKLLKQIVLRDCTESLEIKFLDNTNTIGQVVIAPNVYFDKCTYPIEYLCRNGASAKIIESVAKSYKDALKKKANTDNDTPFDLLFTYDWGDRDNLDDGSDQQLNCLEIIPRLMSDSDSNNTDSLTDLLWKDAIPLLGPKPYPGISQEKCFKLMCYIDVSSFKCINDTFGDAKGDEAIKFYATEIDKVLKNVLSSLRKGKKKRKLYGTTFRKGGDEFVIIITGVLASTCDKEVPNEVYNALVSNNGLASVKYEKEKVFSFLRAGFCWCKMNNEINEMDEMIKLAEILQEVVKMNLKIGRSESKSLEQIQKLPPNKPNKPNNVSDLIEYNDENMKKYKEQLDDQKDKEAQILKSYMALGLADGYFWNLVREVAIDIRDAKRQPMELTYSKEDTVRKKVVKRFLVVVPSELDWDKEDPIAAFIKSNSGDTSKNYLKDCKIQKSANRSESSRIKWVTDVIMSSDLNEQDEGIVIDIPTTLTSIIMSLKEKSKSSDAIIDIEEFQVEAMAFCHQIDQRLKEHNLDQYVTVVQMDKLDNFMDKIKKENDDLNNDSNCRSDVLKCRRGKRQRDSKCRSDILSGRREIVNETAHTDGIIENASTT